MRIFPRYPDPPPFYRKLLDFGLNRVLLHLVVLQFLIQCLHDQNNAPCGELIDFCDKDGDMCLWKWMFWADRCFFCHTRGASLWLARSGVDALGNSGHEECSICDRLGCLLRGRYVCEWIYRARVI